jgi:hypothetical protein
MTPSSPPCSTRCSHRHRRPRHPDAGAGAAGQRDRRTLRQQRPPRAPRPHADHQSAARSHRARRVPAPLQQPPATRDTRPGRSPRTTPPADERDEYPPTARPARWTAPRVSAGRVTCAAYLAPTRRRSVQEEQPCQTFYCVELDTLLAANPKQAHFAMGRRWRAAPGLPSMLRITGSN